MPRMFASSKGCQGVDLGNGHTYNNDRSGLINVTDGADVRALKAGGYVVAGSVARGRNYWTCDDCSRDANINHCAKCDSENLRKVEA